MTDQTIVAVYDTPAHAELAVQDLLQANVPESAIHRHAEEGSYAGSSTAPSARAAEPGFWATLFGGEPDHDTTVYDRSVAGGSHAVTVKVPEQHAEDVMDILARHNPVDLDERAGSYGLTQTMVARAPTAGRLPASGPATAPAGDTIELSEESLAVGKRVVNNGTTRIRRFVVETPVEEQVRLRDEKVTVERRPITDGRSVSTADWIDKTIEMAETMEEAVVSKTARVTEEIALRKVATDRTETIHDTVRREDVEVVKVPGEMSTSNTTIDPAASKPVI